MHDVLVFVSPGGYHRCPHTRGGECGVACAHLQPPHATWLITCVCPVRAAKDDGPSLWLRGWVRVYGCVHVPVRCGPYCGTQPRADTWHSASTVGCRLQRRNNLRLMLFNTDSTSTTAAVIDHYPSQVGTRAWMAIQLAQLGTSQSVNARHALAPPIHVCSGWGGTPPSRDGGSTDTQPQARATPATAVWQSFGVRGWTAARAKGTRFSCTARHGFARKSCLPACVRLLG